MRVKMRLHGMMRAVGGGGENGIPHTGSLLCLSLVSNPCNIWSIMGIAIHFWREREVSWTQNVALNHRWKSWHSFLVGDMKRWCRHQGNKWRTFIAFCKEKVGGWCRRALRPWGLHSGSGHFQSGSGKHSMLCTRALGTGLLRAGSISVHSDQGSPDLVWQRLWAPTQKPLFPSSRGQQWQCARIKECKVTFITLPSQQLWTGQCKYTSAGDFWKVCFPGIDTTPPSLSRYLPSWSGGWGWRYSIPFVIKRQSGRRNHMHRVTEQRARRSPSDDTVTYEIKMQSQHRNFVSESPKLSCRFQCK